MASTEYNINNRFLLVITFHIKALVVTYNCVIMEHTTVSVLMIPLLLSMIRLHKLSVLNWDTQIVSILYPIINNISIAIYTGKIRKAIVIITYVY